MRTKKIISILLAGLLLAGCGPTKSNQQSPNANKPSASTKILINELPLADRPFTVLVPHSTNKLFTFVTKGAQKATTAGVDLEYTSGDLLKGANAAIVPPIPETFVKAIILGSCSTGGKCTFDTNLKSGTMKFKMTLPGQDAIQMLKGDFTFVSGQNNLPDGKVNFAPTKTSIKSNLILMNSFGLPSPVGKESVMYPVVISAVDDKTITGTLTINQPGATSVLIYDGSAYQQLKAEIKDGVITASINQKPWSMPAQIIRDDERGSQESLNLYLLGPIVLVK